MKLLNKIIWPIYPYIAVLILYFYFRQIGDFWQTGLNLILYDLFVFAAPIILFLWINLRLSHFIRKPKHKLAFLCSAIPGFFPGAIFGYGIIFVIYHTVPLTENVVYGSIIGGISAVFFGLVGILWNLIRKN